MRIGVDVQRRKCKWEKSCQDSKSGRWRERRTVDSRRLAARWGGVEWRGFSGWTALTRLPREKMGSGNYRQGRKWRKRMDHSQEHYAGLRRGPHPFNWRQGGEWTCKVGSREERHGASYQSWCPFSSSWIRKLSSAEHGGNLNCWALSRVCKHIYELKIRCAQILWNYMVHFRFGIEAIFTSFWALKHDDWEPATYIKKHGIMRVPALLVKLTLGISDQLKACPQMSSLVSYSTSMQIWLI